jgi:hypothetical protein
MEFFFNRLPEQRKIFGEPSSLDRLPHCAQAAQSAMEFVVRSARFIVASGVLKEISGSTCQA